MLSHSEGFCFHRAQSIIYYYTLQQGEEMEEYMQNTQRILTPTAIVFIWTWSHISPSLLYCRACSL